ncbi:cytochrome P450 [Streptomyces sp. OF3]|uniref:Cytochrome P450 n=1 Tax=Streptomyces alkaliterrae TaxID=2213162 RepID=A0A7W3WQN2_9ACTN|nr:cytochrome P450 [Streptomyces alkaliterrae]
MAPVLLPGDIRAWLVLDYHTNLTVMRTPSVYSSDSRHWSVTLPPDSPLVPITTWQPLVAFVDGQEHGRLRGAITGALDRYKGAGRGVRRYVHRYMSTLVDGFQTQGRCDLVPDLAEKLSILVLARLFGLAEREALPLGAAIRDMVQGSATAVRSNEYVTGVMANLVREKRATPGEDIASWLLQDEAALDDVEVMEHLRHALVSSHEKTTNFIANTLKAILTERAFHATLTSGQMTLPDALEEVLWNDPPLTTVPTRWATNDTVLAGRHISRGDMVMLGLAAGNSDPAIRATETPVRNNRAHLSFGHGPHECPGQHLGRAIAEAAVDALLTMLPDVQLDAGAELPVTASLVSNRLNSLPVTFSPRGRTAAAGAPAGQPDPPAPAGAEGAGVRAGAYASQGLPAGAPGAPGAPVAFGAAGGGGTAVAAGPGLPPELPPAQPDPVPSAQPAATGHRRARKSWWPL